MGRRARPAIEPEEKEIKVYTYYYPPEETKWSRGRSRPLFLAYTTHDRPSPAQKVYTVKAISGYEAKKIAIKMRKADEGYYGNSRDDS
jgi:hypothetical protein